jgi:hypothetical protein
VDYGDGGGPLPLLLQGTGFGLAHIYAQPGMYTATVRVLDDDLGLGTGAFSVQVRQTRWHILLPAIHVQHHPWRIVLPAVFP